MRTWGRIYPPEGGDPYWAEVTTDANGANDNVWITTLCQCLLLNLGESPFFANYGIPAQQSIITQVYPDYYVYQTQQQFSPYFASLIITKLPSFEPKYAVKVVTNQGVVTGQLVPV